jgi:hypothetical protein
VRTHPTDVGQWVWSSADSAHFVEATRSIPDLISTLWIGTVRASRDGAVEGQLARSPHMPAVGRMGVVIRFDETFSRAWARGSDSAIAAAVGASLRSVLGAAGTAGVTIAEVQLDYDCPERLLPRWSVVVRQLARGPLAGRSIWLTSLVSHVRHREYGDLFRESVAGHIVQVFDTGDRMSPAYARQIERLASGQRMPFRLGVGAFERRFANGRMTEHRAWFGATRVMAESEWYRGVWVFPGGESWVSLLEARP